MGQRLLVLVAVVNFFLVLNGGIVPDILVALGDEQKFVAVFAFLINLDLCRQIGLGILLLEHGERRQLRIAKVIPFIGIPDAFGERASSSPPVKTNLPFLPMTMAVPVSWHIGKMPPAAMFAFFKRSKATNLSFAVASRSSRILASWARWGQQMVDVAHRLFGEKPQRFALDAEECVRPEALDPHAVRGFR